jgi:Ca-activated chloride channel family protein
MYRILALLLVSLPLAISAQNDRSLSPYFIVNVDSGESVPDFPLERTGVEVSISGVIADVTVTQVYTNHSARALQAVYVFPGSTNAAVYAMEMQIGRRVIEAQIMEKNDARQVYEEAKTAGKTASLLEQKRPNIFSMSIANVMPGDSVIVRMSYTERLVPTAGVYEFVYPTVVAPRYTGAGAPLAAIDKQTGIASAEIPYTRKGIKPMYEFGMNVSIASGIPFEFIRSTTHKVLLSFETANTATLLLDSSERSGGNRDFILQYRFAGGKIETGLMLYEGKDENFFMLMVEPPKRVPLDSIPPREYIFVMDVSGSMAGYAIETSKKLLRNLVGGLRLTDKFNVIQFAGGGALLSPYSLDATAQNIDSAIAFIDHVQAGGGTELNHAMRTAMNIPFHAGYSRSIVIVTDGLIAAEADVLRSMRAHLDSANVFSFGIGVTSNRYLIEAMAYCGNGEPAVVTREADADSAAARFRDYISSPVLSDIRIQYNGFDAYDTEPVAVPDLFASRPLIITGKYRGKSTGKISVSGMTGAGAYHKEISVDSVKPDKQHKAIRLLWARDRIKYLSYLDDPGGYNWYRAIERDSSVQQEITALGLHYGLLTSYTSFVAVDKRIRNKDPQGDSSVVQPLPLPAGMENSAIGMSGTMKEVVIIDASRVTSLQICSPGVMSACIVTPSRPEFTSGAPGRQHPKVMGDLNRFYNGEFILPVMTNYGQPFFTAGASGRMLSLLPVEMIGAYTLGSYGIQASGMSSTIHTGSFGFSTWLPGRTQVSLSATNFGTQNLYFSNNRRINERWGSELEIAEQWKGVSTDRNNDGYEDLSNGVSTALHHRLIYNKQTDQAKSRTFSNDLYFHSSWLRAGQTSSDLYTTQDQTMGLYIAPRAFIEMGHGDYLDVRTSVAVASIDDRWGIDRFHLNTTQFTLAADYEWSKNYFTFITGASGWLSYGEEKWNTVRISAAHQSGAIYASSDFRRNNWLLNGALRAEVNDVGGLAVLPALVVSRTFNNSLTVGVRFNRYRDVPFAAGQLLPLFYSSRELSVAPDAGLNQGWNFRASLTYRRYAPRAWEIKLLYDAVLPEHSVVIDMDSDAGRTSVYGVKGGSLFHRGVVTFGMNLAAQWRLEAEYAATIVNFRYGENTLQQPLLPVNRGYASLIWTHKYNHIHAHMQVAYTGKQRIPQAGWAPAYATLNLQAKYKFRTDRFTVFAGVFNLLDYRQRQFLMTTNDQFDGWKVWAPVAGRTFQAGVSMHF